MFLHFGLIHLLLNMWALWSIGKLTEHLYGSAQFLLVYIFAGLCGSVASLLWRADVNSAGASGAIFGILGALLAFMLNPKTQVPASVASAQRNSAFVFVAYNLFNGLTHAGIDNACHLGGLLGGFAMGSWLARPLDSEAREDWMPQLTAALFGGTIALIALSWPLTHPGATKVAELHFKREMQWLGDEEDRLLADQRALDLLVVDKKITSRKWGGRVQKTLVPRWQAAEDRLSHAELPPESREIPLRTALLGYIDEKRLGLDLLADARWT
jgi:rhomboid protease GluP